MGVKGGVPFLLEGRDQGRLGVVRVVRGPGLPGGQVLYRRDGIVLEAQGLEELEGLEKIFFPGHVGFILAERAGRVNECLERVRLASTKAIITYVRFSAAGLYYC